jgi:hypothetical protein
MPHTVRRLVIAIRLDLSTCAINRGCDAVDSKRDDLNDMLWLLAVAAEQKRVAA